MSDEITKHEGARAAIQTLRSLMTLDGDETLSIAKMAINDGAKGLVARGIAVLQRWNEVRFGQALLDELEEMRSAGKIRENFNRTDAGISSLHEFLEMIGDKPDEERFRAFCALFMSANATDADSNEAIFDIELMGILRRLSAGEMHLLSAVLKVPSYPAGYDLMGSLAKELGYNANALVQKNMRALLAEGLVAKRSWEDPSGPAGQEKQLLTDFGFALLKRIKSYDEFKDRSRSPEPANEQTER